MPPDALPPTAVPPGAADDESRGRPPLSWVARGALAGAAAAGVWLATEPVLRRVSGLRSYGEARLLGRMVSADGPWRAVGTVTHLVNGAAFGAVFAALGGGGVRRGVLAAQAENAVLWPGFVLADRLHPDRRDGSWPPLVTSRQVAVHELLGHLVFGAALGALLGERHPGTARR